MGSELALFYWHTAHVFLYLIITIALTCLGLRLFRLTAQQIGWKALTTSGAVKIPVSIILGFCLNAAKGWGWNQLPNMLKRGSFPIKYWLQFRYTGLSLSRPSVYAQLCYYVFLTPIGEEIFFRGLVYTVLRNKLPVRWAIVLNALLSALSHFHFSHHDMFQWELFISHFLHGLLCAAVLEWSGALWCPISTHIASNLVKRWFSWAVRYPPRFV